MDQKSQPARLQVRYKEEVIPQMMKRFGYKNPMQVPRLKKIVVNMGVGEALTDIKIMDKAVEELALITGQKPLLRRARTAISNFKLKKNAPVGCKVTLRRRIMYEFMDRLISFAIPRIKDFRGVNPGAFDKDGNFTLGLSEQAIFPEINYDKISRVQGMDITFVIEGGSKEESRELLKHFGMPFKSE
ncbi:MAG: 50S ribosomal protein L5 [Candidatus Omnitrophica bacterium]|nr:50S ribosomal protein L5 [Candidatus Omnitrophota bacterium]